MAWSPVSVPARPLPCGLVVTVSSHTRTQRCHGQPPPLCCCSASSSAQHPSAQSTAPGPPTRSALLCLLGLTTAGYWAWAGSWDPSRTTGAGSRRADQAWLAGWQRAQPTGRDPSAVAPHHACPAILHQSNATQSNQARGPPNLACGLSVPFR